MDPFGQIAPLEQRASDLENKALEAQVAGTKLPDLLRQAVTERFKNSPIQQQREVAVQDFLTAAPNARAELSTLVNTPIDQGGAILSPNQQQAIVSGRRAAMTVPMISLNDLLKSQFGTMEQLVGAGTNAFNAQTQALQGQAQLARQQSNSVLDRLLQQSQLEMAQRELALKEASAGSGSATVQKSFKEIDNKLASSSIALEKIRQAKQSLASGYKTGGFQNMGIVKGLLSRFGKGTSQESQAMEGLFASINTNLFGEAGKAFTESERILLEGKIPDARYSANVNMQRLNALEAETLAKQQQLLMEASSL